jgi:hypothetical protein
VLLLLLGSTASALILGSFLERCSLMTNTVLQSNGVRVKV